MTMLINYTPIIILDGLHKFQSLAVSCNCSLVIVIMVINLKAVFAVVNVDHTYSNVLT